LARSRPECASAARRPARGQYPFEVDSASLQLVLKFAPRTSGNSLTNAATSQGGNMKRPLIFVSVVVISFLPGFLWRPKAAPAAPLPQQGCAVPKSWGTFRAAVGSNLLLFEDSSGTIRWFNFQNSFAGTPCNMVTRQ